MNGRSLAPENILNITTSPAKNTLQGADAPARSTPIADASSAHAEKTAISSKNSVDISSVALQLSLLHSGDHDINIDRVNEIRAALESGELAIDTSRIADGLIASARELLK